MSMAKVEFRFVHSGCIQQARPGDDPSRVEVEATGTCLEWPRQPRR